MQRLYILYRLPDLDSIDGVKVTDQERRLARPCTPTGYKVLRRDWLTCDRNNERLGGLVGGEGGSSSDCCGGEEGQELRSHVCSLQDFSASPNTTGGGNGDEGEDDRIESYKIRLGNNGDTAIQPVTLAPPFRDSKNMRILGGTGIGIGRGDIYKNATNAFVGSRGNDHSTIDPMGFEAASSSAIRRRSTIQHPPVLTYNGNEPKVEEETTCRGGDDIGAPPPIPPTENNNHNPTNNSTTGHPPNNDPTLQDATHTHDIAQDLTTVPLPLHHHNPTTTTTTTTTTAATTTTTALSKAFSLFPHTGRAIAACSEFSLVLPEHGSYMSNTMSKMVMSKTHLTTDTTTTTNYNNTDDDTNDDDINGAKRLATKHTVTTSTTTTATATGGLVAHSKTTDYMELHCLSTCPNIDGSVTYPPYPATTTKPTPLVPTNSSSSSASSSSLPVTSSSSTSKKEATVIAPLSPTAFIENDSESSRQPRASMPPQLNTTTTGGATTTTKTCPNKKNLDSFFMAKRTKSRSCGATSNHHPTNSGGTAQNHLTQVAISEATDGAISGQMVSKCFPKSSLSSPFPIQFRDGTSPSTSATTTPHNNAAITTTARVNNLDCDSIEKENTKPVLEFAEATRLQFTPSSSILPRSSSSLHELDNHEAHNNTTKKEGTTPRRNKGEKKQKYVPKSIGNTDIIPTMVNVRLKKGKKKGGDLRRPPPSPASVMRTFPQSSRQKKKQPSSKRRFVSPFSSKRRTKDLEELQMTNSVMDQLEEEEEADGIDEDDDDEDGDDNSELDICSNQVLVRGSG